MAWTWHSATVGNTVVPIAWAISSRLKGRLHRPVADLEAGLTTALLTTQRWETHRPGGSESNRRSRSPATSHGSVHFILGAAARAPTAV
jgi:hypothetical protein